MQCIDYFVWYSTILQYFQIETLNDNVKQAANFLQRCPSCMKNFVQHICDFTCSPKQSQFMKVMEVEKGDKGKSARSLLEIIIILSRTIWTKIELSVMIIHDVEYLLIVPLRHVVPCNCTHSVSHWRWSTHYLPRSLSHVMTVKWVKRLCQSIYLFWIQSTSSVASRNLHFVAINSIRWRAQRCDKLSFMWLTPGDQISIEVTVCAQCSRTMTEKSRTKSMNTILCMHDECSILHRIFAADSFMAICNSEKSTGNWEQTSFSIHAFRLHVMNVRIAAQKTNWNAMRISIRIESSTETDWNWKFSRWFVQARTWIMWTFTLPKTIWTEHISRVHK